MPDTFGSLPLLATTAVPLPVIVAIVVVAAFVLIAALFAIVKGRGFRFGLNWRNTKVEIDIAEKKEASPNPIDNSGSISGVSVLDKGKIEGSENVNIHVGHSINRKD